MMPRERILVPLDGSARAERILPVVKNLACRLHASTVLLRVLPQEASGSDERAAFGYLDSVVAEIQGSANADGRGTPISCQVVRGNPAQEIQGVVEACQISLIALSTHGRSGLSRWLMGSVAETIVRTVTVPVLVFNERMFNAQGSDGRTIRHQGIGGGPVLVPLDGSPLAEIVLPIASRFASALGTRVHLTEVLSPVPRGIAVGVGVGIDEWGLGEEVVESTREEAAAALAAISRRLQDDGAAVTTDLSIGFPQEHLLATIEREEAAVVAMATHGRSGFKRALLGSVADHVVRHAPCPVLLVGPAASSF
jgi:nucleotide-binding universal stress UspA family protein